MLTITPKEEKTAVVHQYLLGSVSPRPICFASTISADGTPNIAPYSFFNCFSSNPPILIFSSNRTVANNTTKDTLANAHATKEVVVNVVNHDIVRQMTVASISYPSDVNEFDKAGLTPIASDLVKPFRIKEAPVQMECKVNDIISLGNTGGAGNLIICEVLRMHINEEILDENQQIDPHKIDLMGRMGRAFYCRASGDAVHKIYQNVTQIGIGADSLPLDVRFSEILTGNDIGNLAAQTELPSNEEITKIGARHKLERLMVYYENDLPTLTKKLHLLAKQLIEAENAKEALQMLMAFDTLKKKLYQ